MGGVDKMCLITSGPRGCLRTTQDKTELVKGSPCWDCGSITIDISEVEKQIGLRLSGRNRYLAEDFRAQPLEALSKSGFLYPFGEGGSTSSCTGGQGCQAGGTFRGICQVPMKEPQGLA